MYPSGIATRIEKKKKKKRIWAGLKI